MRPRLLTVGLVAVCVLVATAVGLRYTAAPTPPGQVGTASISPTGVGADDGPDAATGPRQVTGVILDPVSGEARVRLVRVDPSDPLPPLKPGVVEAARKDETLLRGRRAESEAGAAFGTTGPVPGQPAESGSGERP